MKDYKNWIYKPNTFKVEVSQPSHKEYIFIKSTFDEDIKILVPNEQISKLINILKEYET